VSKCGVLIIPDYRTAVAKDTATEFTLVGYYLKKLLYIISHFHSLLVIRCLFFCWTPDICCL